MKRMAIQPWLKRNAYKKDAEERQSTRKMSGLPENTLHMRPAEVSKRGWLINSSAWSQFSAAGQWCLWTNSSFVTSKQERTLNPRKSKNVFFERGRKRG